MHGHMGGTETEGWRSNFQWTHHSVVCRGVQRLRRIYQIINWQVSAGLEQEINQVDVVAVQWRSVWFQFVVWNI